MATLRELKGRIGSVASSEKITGAMKMISSAKMHKAEGQLRSLVPFRSQVETIIANLLSADSDFASPLLEVRNVEHATIVVWGSDEGLCGAYNVNIAKILAVKVGELAEKYGQQLRIEIVPVGAKMHKAVAKMGTANVNVDESFANVSAKSDGEDVKRFTEELTARFVDHKTDLVDLLYMNFQSVARQRPRFDTFLPVSPEAFSKGEAKKTARPYIFEPDAETIFRMVLPLLELSVMQDVFCQNRASEQAARVMAMQAANDNAKKLLESLRLEYNKLRQQSITNELLDIVGGQIR